MASRTGSILSRTQTLISNNLPATDDGPENHEKSLSRHNSGTSNQRKLVFTDPVAFRYLQEDESVSVVSMRTRLIGYELYVVEQWACSRVNPTFTICTHTGDESHSILVNVLSVPDNPAVWSRRLRIYHDATSHASARSRETSLGTLMVTNLSNFPSHLNVVLVPEGDIRKHRQDFVVNQNLKRMGCSGRAAMSVTYPPSGTINKFYHLYRTSEDIPLYDAVIELVRFCQIALVLFGKLLPAYTDGLLCDVTEKAIGEWWDEIGTDFHNVEPSDGILGPTTVSALIGLVVGGHSRLKETGAPVGKDPLDLQTMKRAIFQFQRTNNMDRTKRLDRATLDRLHRSTARGSNEESFGVGRVLKSTVAGIGGKGGEMIARGLGGSHEKFSSTDVETLDIDRLAQLVNGRSLKWLWQGKPLKSNTGLSDLPDALDSKAFLADQANDSSADESSARMRTSAQNEARDEHKRSRLRAAVGLPGSRSHGRTIVDNMGKGSAQEPDESSQARVKNDRYSESPSRESHYRPLYNQSLDTASVEPPVGSRTNTQAIPSGHRQALRGIDHIQAESPNERKIRLELSRLKEELQARVYQDFVGSVNFAQPESRALRRSLSDVQLRPLDEVRAARLPRQMSLSMISDALEAPTELLSIVGGEKLEGGERSKDQSMSNLVQLHRQELEESRQIASKLVGFERGLVAFTNSRIDVVERTEQEAQAQQDELNRIYKDHLEEYQAMQATSADLLTREKAQLNERVRTIDMLGQKLDYELSSLQSRMLEVEESVDDFESRVIDIENRVKALVVKPEAKQSSWFWKIFSFW